MVDMWMRGDGGREKVRRTVRGRKGNVSMNCLSEATGRQSQDKERKKWNLPYRWFFKGLGKGQQLLR